MTKQTDTIRQGTCAADVVMDEVDWARHVRIYHGGRFDPLTDKCDVYERLMEAERTRELLSHTDADGDGHHDDYEEPTAPVADDCHDHGHGDGGDRDAPHPFPAPYSPEEILALLALGTPAPRPRR